MIAQKINRETSFFWGRIQRFLYGERNAPFVRKVPNGHRCRESAPSPGERGRGAVSELCRPRCSGRFGASGLSRCEAARALGRFRCDSDKIQICSANLDFLSSLRSKLPRCPLLRASGLSRSRWAHGRVAFPAARFTNRIAARFLVCKARFGPGSPMRLRSRFFSPPFQFHRSPAG